MAAQAELHGVIGVPIRAVATVGSMSKPEKRSPIRLLVLAVMAVGIVVAVRNALADKGGSYDPDDTGDR